MRAHRNILQVGRWKRSGNGLLDAIDHADDEAYRIKEIERRSFDIDVKRERAVRAKQSYKEYAGKQLCFIYVPFLKTRPGSAPVNSPSAITARPFT